MPKAIKFFLNQNQVSKRELIDKVEQVEKDRPEYREGWADERVEMMEMNAKYNEETEQELKDGSKIKVTYKFEFKK